MELSVCGWSFWVLSLVDPSWRCLVCHCWFRDPSNVGPGLFRLSTISGKVAFFAAVEAGSSRTALWLSVLSRVDSLAPLSWRLTAAQIHWYWPIVVARWSRTGIEPLVG
jgi:hypothetical protein